ncbi:hypothetical protein DB346_03145 [Verrucomicrobia bacterium LW23]|nr:hypothetical protein DB346_03145 [Verrucomicrobia bacterium LW23]
MPNPASPAPGGATSGWLHVIFSDDPQRIFLYRKSEIYRAVLTRDDVELIMDDGSIVVHTSRLAQLVPDILDETKTTNLKEGIQGISSIEFYLLEPPAKDGAVDED